MKRRICFVDAFDSFSNNVVGLLERVTGANVTTINIHDEIAAKNLAAFLRQYDAVVIGPGPGHPEKQVDTGLINQIWSLADRDLLPVLGVCLGFQSLAVACDASITQLKRARHGIVTDVVHCNQDIFKGVGNLLATQYHSLQVDLGHEISTTTGRPKKLYDPTQQCPLLLPLAWDFDPINGPVLTAIRHSRRPFWGLQFHPESICTSTEANRLIESWWQEACAWNLSQRRETELPHLPQKCNSDALKSPLIKPSCGSAEFGQHMATMLDGRASRFNWRKANASLWTPTKLCEALEAQGNDVILLDSQGHKTGNFSIIGLVIPEETVKITYNVANRTVSYGRSLTEQYSTQLDSIEEVWPVLQQTLDSHNPLNYKNMNYDKFSTSNRNFLKQTFNRQCPYWGGFMGYISYEAGLETIQVDAKCDDHNKLPDINLAFVQRSIVFDHVESQIYIQSLLPNDEEWMTGVQTKIIGLANGQQELRTKDLKRPSLDKYLAQTTISRPGESEYRAKVRTCQTSLASGDSYELCLTDRTRISIPAVENKPLDPWQLYLRLRTRNAAPMGSFIRLGATTICSSSPERFLSWSRAGHAQFRPIKGTVKKGPDMTSEKAHEILNSSKERAENLMIVDLIRHDLSGVIGAENVTVAKLMVVEEYETVWQLVSVIEGDLAPPEKELLQGRTSRPTGIDVLKASLPPGSMTGAPKKRSCEILQTLEKQPRGVYSGVIGYLDVGGGGDWAVVIRTAISHGGGQEAVSHDSSACSSDTEDGPVSDADSITSRIQPEPTVWMVGAGGAVTIQSTDEDEFLEMETKANSVLAAFEPSS